MSIDVVERRRPRAPGTDTVVAATSYTIVDLSAVVSASANAFVATALNNSGQAVGYDPDTSSNGNAGAAYLIASNGTFAALSNTGNAAAFYALKAC